MNEPNDKKRNDANDHSPTVEPKQPSHAGEGQAGTRSDPPKPAPKQAPKSK